MCSFLGLETSLGLDLDLDFADYFLPVNAAVKEGKPVNLNEVMERRLNL